MKEHPDDIRIRDAIEQLSEACWRSGAILDTLGIVAPPTARRFCPLLVETGFSTITIYRTKSKSTGASPSLWGTARNREDFINPFAGVGPDSHGWLIDAMRGYNTGKTDAIGKPISTTHRTRNTRRRRARRTRP